jgi:2-polyprenyl-3-methyl-5-hydroxy-6-metoxy-1,4-benzoquinol methylase
MSATPPSGPNKEHDINQIREFWEENPIGSLESPFTVGTQEFFKWGDQVRGADIETFTMYFYEFDQHQGENVLDAGCGPGWITSRLARGHAQVNSVDIARRAVELTRRRLELDGSTGNVIQASIEQLPFANSSFDFVVCAGVLQSTPDTSQAIHEIHRVLKSGGRAMVCFYYRNWALSRPAWPITRLLIRALLRNVPGRKSFSTVQTVEEFVRVYDGDHNPLSKVYSRDEALDLLRHFTVERLEAHYFPLRFFPFGGRFLHGLHRLLDRTCGLSLYASLKKV